MQEKEAKCDPTGENQPVPNSAEIVFEVQRHHRNLDPPANLMTVAPAGHRVKDFTAPFMGPSRKRYNENSKWVVCRESIVS
jgi:hypothetical protein